ncbi:MAG: PEP-CTERM sorting domain-containing protein [Alphaproteobacteria bacterium]|nr:PEP-CTERM sorting domain-containing protein [Alphaproteobacteria bacterium]
MKRVLLAAVFAVIAVGQAQAFTCDPGGDLPGGTLYTTAGLSGQLVNGSGVGITVDLFDHSGIGGIVSGNAIPFCLVNPANTLADRQIFIYEENPIQFGVNPVASYQVLIDGIDVSASFTYTADPFVALQNTGVTASADVKLTTGFHTLSIINLVQQHALANGTGTFSGNGFSNVPVAANYSLGADLNVSIQGINNIPLPEPASMVMFGVALAGLAATRRRRRI